MLFWWCQKKAWDMHYLHVGLSGDLQPRVERCGFFVGRLGWGGKRRPSKSCSESNREAFVENLWWDFFLEYWSEMFFNEKLGIHTYVYIYIIHYTLYCLYMSYFVMLIWPCPSLSLAPQVPSLIRGMHGSWERTMPRRRRIQIHFSRWVSMWQSWHMWCHCLILWSEGHDDPIEWEFKVEESWTNIL